MSTNVKRQKTKPPAMPVRIENIPAELKQIPKWVMWKWTWKNEKWDKPPYATDGSYGSSTNADKWTTFDKAVKALPDFDGIGLAMGSGIDLIGIDLDNCIDPSTGFMSVEAESVIEQIDSYAEISPSGTGAKIWVLGDYDKAKWRSKVGNVEVYRDGRYFTVTGNVIHKRPLKTIDASFYTFLDKYLPKETETKTDSAPIEASDDAAKIKHALNSCLLVEYDAGTEGDGSRRLVKYARQCVRAGLSPEGAITVIRMLEPLKPFPKKWTDEQIRQRYKDATNQSEVGEAIRIYEQSDYGVARRVRDYSKGSLLYVAKWGKWLSWNGRAFVEDNSDKFAEMVVAVSKLMLGEQVGDEKEQKAWTAFCMGYQSNRGIAAIEHLSRGLMAVDYRALDQKTELFHCENGVINLSRDARAIQEHNRENLNTQVSEIPFIPGAKCPRWESFIFEVTAGNRDLARYLQQVFGYCLTGIPTQELFILHGGGNNGKGAMTRVLLKLLGEYAGAISQDLLMNSPNQHPTQFAYLYGKRCVVAQETGRDCTLNENQVKMLTGGDPIQCRRMREDFWSFEPTHKILLTTNNIPTIRGSDNGIWRRIKLIPFSVQFEPDLNLEPALHAELPGILQWALAGYELYNMLGGFQEPDVVKVAKEQYRADMSLVLQFVEDKCVLSPEASVETAKLYQNFKMYCEEYGHHPYSCRTFSGDLPASIKNGRTNSARIKIGIGLKSEFEPC